MREPVALLPVLAALGPAGVPSNEGVLEDDGRSPVYPHSRRDDGPALVTARTANRGRVAPSAEKRVVGRAPRQTRFAERVPARETDGANHETAAQGTDGSPGPLSSTDGCSSNAGSKRAQSSIYCRLDVDAQSSRVLAACGHLNAQHSPDHGAYEGSFGAPGTGRSRSGSRLCVHRRARS